MLCELEGGEGSGGISLQTITAAIGKTAQLGEIDFLLSSVGSRLH